MTDITPSYARQRALKHAQDAEELILAAATETAPEWAHTRATEALAAATLGRLYADLAATGPVVHVHVPEGADYAGTVAAVEDALGTVGDPG